MENKKFFKLLISGIIFILGLIMGIMIIIDPFFHYHKPLKFLSYRLGNQRYINDGVIRHFDYNGIITGTSMTENFKASQFDELFNLNSIKIPFSGGSYKEIHENLERALKRNNNIKIILRGLDYEKIISDVNMMGYDSYPTYLYDNNIFNDYKYLLNKDLIAKGLGAVTLYTLKGRKTTSFDEYSSWDYGFGKEKVLSQYKRNDDIKEKVSLTEEEKKIIDENIEQNVLSLPKQYPNVKFIYFITPYSIVYWDSINRDGTLEKQIMAEKYMIEKILEVPNIELYSFFNNYELITNLDNYKDPNHYISKINEEILDWISKKEYLLTKENYKEYIERNLKFYSNYNYDKIFE